MRVRCVVCQGSEPPATPASGDAWLCGPCFDSRVAYLRQSDGTVLDSIAWAARTARASERRKISEMLESEAPKWNACSHAVSYWASKVREDLSG